MEMTALQDHQQIRSAAVGPLVLLNPAARHDLTELRGWHEEQVVFLILLPPLWHKHEVLLGLLKLNDLDILMVVAKVFKRFSKIRFDL